MSFEPMEDDHHTVSQEWVNLAMEGETFKSEALPRFTANFHRLESPQVKICLLSLSIFPENIAIKKKPLIYWWMGEGIVTKAQGKTAEEVGELILQELLNQGFIRSSSEKKPSSVNSFIVYPWIRRMLIPMAEKNKFQVFDPQWRPCNGEHRAFLCQGKESYNMSNGEELWTVFNVDVKYLGMTPEWLTKLSKVEILQMGRWQNSITHHIEVENKMLFNSLGSQKQLKYLSLRGISTIETLPDSISKLISLQILDLSACHNLEKLPPGISELKKLTHLDVSECYLLESMPKGLDQLLNLQVLKGFVIGKARRSSCKIIDLAQLTNLRKLSIRVRYQGETQKEDHQLESLKHLSALRTLTLSWGLVSSVPASPSLPEGLTKLDLWCVPFATVHEWLRPSRLLKLEKLYIRGGKLNSLSLPDSRECWNVKFLRLKYLKDLEIDRNQLAQLFPQCLNSPSLDSDITLNGAG